MRIIESYLEINPLTGMKVMLPNKWGSKRFIHRNKARKLKKLERQNRKSGRSHNG